MPISVAAIAGGKNNFTQKIGQSTDALTNQAVAITHQTLRTR
jgi:hypothetical protein